MHIFCMPVRGGQCECQFRSLSFMHIIICWLNLPCMFDTCSLLTCIRLCKTIAAQSESSTLSLTCKPKEHREHPFFKIWSVIESQTSDFDGAEFLGETVHSVFLIKPLELNSARQSHQKWSIFAQASCRNRHEMTLTWLVGPQFERVDLSFGQICSQGKRCLNALCLKSTMITSSFLFWPEREGKRVLLSFSAGFDTRLRQATSEQFAFDLPPSCLIEQVERRRRDQLKYSHVSLLSVSSNL